VKKKQNLTPNKGDTKSKSLHSAPHKKKRPLSASPTTASTNSFSQPTSAVDAATECLNRGYAPVPIPKGEKGPTTKGWLDLEVNHENVADLFQADGNCGIRTGQKSGGLHDVDVDDKEALDLVAGFLPPTAMTSGRSGQGPSHHWYIAPDAKTEQWKDDLGMIVELRGDKVQTLVPPSVHKEGDRVVWFGGGAPTRVAGVDLKRRCALFACAMTLGRHYPPEGNRHEATLGVAGMLLQAGVTDAEAEQVILAAALRGDDEEAEERLTAVATTRARMVANEPILSGGNVKKHFGTATQKLVRKWLAEVTGSRIVDATDTSDGADEPGASRSLATILLGLAEDLELFHLPGDDSEGWASAINNGRRETFRLHSPQFRSFLYARLWRVHHRAGNPAGLDNALATLEARAIHEGPAARVELRVVGNEKEINIDVGDEDRNVILVTPEGWAVRRDTPVRFFRPRGLLPLPLPERGGTLDLLREFVNIETEDDWLIFLGWLVYTFQSESDFVILTLFGEHDSAKSTVARLAKEFTDPGVAIARPAPVSEDDLAATAKNSRTMAYDNLSAIPAWLADSFCRLATGTCFSGRKYFTNEEEYLIEAKRPVVINAIPDVLERPDLIDRVACIWLPPMTDEKRIPTAEFKSRLDEQRALIFGALLDALSGVLKHLPGVKLDAAPRMADFARWGTALEQYLGYEPGSFLRAYENNRAALVLTGLDDFVLVTPIRLLLKVNKGLYEGTPLQLLGKLNALRTPALEEVRKTRGWPRTAGGLSTLLRRHRRGLEKLGITIETWRAPTRDRTRYIRIRSRGDEGSTTTTSSPAPKMPTKPIKKLIPVKSKGLKFKLRANQEGS
jgi:hypothetical protein